MTSPFKGGLSVFFRVLGSDNLLARSIHPDGRNLVTRWRGFDDEYVVLDDNENVLGVYPKDYVSAILPIQTVGPANVVNQQIQRDSPASPAEGDSQSNPGRVERIYSRE